MTSQFDIFTQYAPMAITLIISGFAAGILAGLLGVGGGIILVPVFYYVFGYFGAPDAALMHMAVGTSLAVIVPTSLSSARSHFRRRAVDFNIIKTWSLGIILGSFLGAFLAAQLETSSLKLLFAGLLLAVSYKMMRGGKPITAQHKLPSKTIQSLIGLLIGAFSAMMGIGGGTMSVPSMAAFGVPLRRAIGTASAIGFIIALPAVIGFIITGWHVSNLPKFSLGYVNFLAFALIIPATITAAPLGAKLAHIIPPEKLARLFGILLCGVALKMLSEHFL